MGVIGLPIAQSKSPALHNGALHAAGLDACYVPLLVHDLAEFLASPLFGSDDYTGKYFPITTFLPDCPYETDTFIFYLSGFWFSPEREMLQASIDKCAENVTGTVRVKLYKGNVIVVGRKAENSLYNATLSTFEDDGGAYDQKDAAGFIKIQALRLRTLGTQRGPPM
jgi:hypothetical protein